MIPATEFGMPKVLPNFEVIALEHEALSLISQIALYVPFWPTLSM